MTNRVVKIQRRLRVLDRRIGGIEHERSSLEAEAANLRDAARCQLNRNANTRCLLPKDHAGYHQVPCVEHGAHREHTTMVGLDSIVICRGRMFDLT